MMVLYKAAERHGRFGSVLEQDFSTNCGQVVQLSVQNITSTACMLYRFALRLSICLLVSMCAHALAAVVAVQASRWFHVFLCPSVFVLCLSVCLQVKERATWCAAAVQPLQSAVMGAWEQQQLLPRALQLLLLAHLLAARYETCSKRLRRLFSAYLQVCLCRTGQACAG